MALFHQRQSTGRFRANRQGKPWTLGLVSTHITIEKSVSSHTNNQKNTGALADTPSCSHFVTFGALITLFALAIDPFSQQLVSFRSCSQGITNDTAHLPHTHNLVNTKDGWGTFANRMSAAAYLSLLGEPMGPSSMNYSCSTGNCSFALHGTVGPSHQTLAIGSECADISHLVEENTDVTQTNVSVSFGPQWHLPHFSDTNTTIPEASVHGAKYIGRMKSMSWEEFGNSYSTTMDGDALFRFTILTVNLDWTDIDRIRVPSNLVGQGQDQKGNNTTMQNPGGQGVDYLIMPKSRPLAVECQLNPEIQTLQSRIVNGALWEKVLDTETGSWEPNGNTSYAFVPKQVLHKKAWKDCEPSPNPTKEFPENTTSSDGKVQRWYPEGCVWNLDTNAHLMIRRALYPHFGHLLEIDHALQPYAALKYNFSHMWMEDLYNNGTASYDSIVAFAAELASSMTTAIRNWGATELNWVEGKVYKMETCVAVNWGWVIVPASLVLAAIEFLLLTIWASPSRKTQQGPWKSSSLAVLFHGLDSGVRKSCGDLPRRSEMWERAEEVQVRLRNDVDGLKLK